MAFFVEMLLIPTFLSSSEIHGLGLFTSVAIPKDTVLEEINEKFDKVFSEDEIKGFPKLFRKFLRHYGYKQDSKYFLSVDNGRFMNHSENPNVFIINGKSISVRYIAVNEELTCNYYHLDDEWEGEDS